MEGVFDYLNYGVDEEGLVLENEDVGRRIIVFELFIVFYDD